MNTLQRMVGSLMSLLVLGSLLAIAIHAVEATSREVQPTHGRKLPPGGVQPSVPPAGRPLYSPPLFMDRGAPISERPFARPFSDRSPSIADRPLAPIGGETQTVPEASPFVWCQGAWVRVDKPPYGCPVR
jgi:hypothetical protein